MAKVWKMYTTDGGLYSFQNEEMQLCDMYRVLVFLQNYFKDRMTESQPERRSLIYEIFRMSHLRKKRQANEFVEDESIRRIYIDGHPLSVSWCVCDGVAITSEDEKGSRTVKEIEQVMAREKSWWNS